MDGFDLDIVCSEQLNDGRILIVNVINKRNDEEDEDAFNKKTDDEDEEKAAINKRNDNEDEEKANEKRGSLKSCGHWTLLIEVFKFLMHFLLVMGLLFFGAIIFAMLEDNDTILDEVLHNCTQKFNRIEEYNSNSYNYSAFSSELQLKYNISLTRNSRESLHRDIKLFIDGEEKRNKQTACRNQIRDKHFIRLKWFYFVVITTTTIGYGDISPKTNEGKIFYIFFSIIGIILMMTLLKSCGALLTTFNRKIYKLVNQCVCNNLVSEELLSVISVTINFLCFMVIGICHDYMTNEKDWPLIDIVYYWIVTLTTVGFGDLTKSLEWEIQHFYDLVIYRIFGLAFIAGIIDSINVYMKFRKKLLRENTRQMSAIGKQVMVQLFSPRANNFAKSNH